MTISYEQVRILIKSNHEERFKLFKEIFDKAKHPILENGTGYKMVKK